MKKILSAAFAVLLTFSPAARAAEVEFRTTVGTMVISVNEEQAPVTAENFLQYVRDGFYDGLIFHRVIPGFVVQGGGFSPEMQQKRTRAPIPYEDNGLKNLRYTLSMARLQNPDSATSQFFINLADNAPLDPPADGGAGYAVFGAVTEGMDVVDLIALSPTTRVGRYSDVPVEPIIITEAVVR